MKVRPKARIQTAPGGASMRRPSMTSYGYFAATARAVDIVGLLGTEIGLRYHRKLIDALKKRDKTLCESLMEAHIEETIQAVLKASIKTQAVRVMAPK
jgi:DNA-binding GntR family transcriptional regulator